MIYFNLSALVIGLLIVVINLPWMLKSKDIRKRFFYILLLLFYFLICGLTAALNETEHYLNYFIYYSLFLFGTLYLTRNSTLNIPTFRTNGFYQMVVRLSKPYLFFYTIYKLVPFVYPIFRIWNLIIPPVMDVGASLEGEIGQSGFSAGIEQVLTIFYLISLSAYISKPKKLIFIMFFFFYLGFANTGYVSRGSILRLLVQIFIIIYINYPRLRRKMLIVSVATVPFLVIFFVWYMYKRLGVDQHLDFMTSLAKLAEIEFSFSAPFDTIYTGIYADPWSYIQSWLTMPLPGPLRFGSQNYIVNYQYTADIYGMYATDANYAVMLPGLAIEGAYCMGVGLAFIHAIMFSITVNLFYNAFLITPSFYMLSIYWCMNIPMGVIRGGTLTLYSFTNKTFLFVMVLLYFLYTMTQKPRVTTRHCNERMEN